MFNIILLIKTQKKFDNRCAAFKFITREITKMSVFLVILWPSFFGDFVDPETSTYGASPGLFLQCATQHLSAYRCTKCEVSEPGVRLDLRL